MISLKNRIATFAVTALIAFAAISVRVQAAGLNKLEAIDVQTLSGQQVQLTLRLSGPAPQPLAFTIDKPARIALDLPGTTIAMPSRRIDVRSGGVDTVLAAEANGRTRIVVDLDTLIPYATKVEGNNILVTLGAARGAAAASPAVAENGAGAGVATAQQAERSIRSIDFRRGADGAGRVIVRLSDPRIPVNVRQEGNQVVVDFTGAKLPKALMRRYDVTDFATPVKTVDAVRIDGSSRLVINAEGDFDQLAYQSDTEYVVEIKHATKLAAQEDKKQYTGERLTLNFQDIDVRSVLQLLADTGGQNIVVSDSVKGNLTLRLQNVPWDQALDIVLRTKGLDKRRDGNVIIVGPAAELAAQEKTQLSARKQIQELEPLRTEFLQVNYAKASDLAKLIKSSDGGKNSMLSPRGALSIDERTNTLLIEDTADRLANIRRLVQTLDVPVKQVLIEARIVVVTDQFERDLGARLGITSVHQNGNNGLLAVTGNGAGADTMTNSATDEPEQHRLALSGDDADARESIPGQSAGREPGGLDRHRPARQQLPPEPGIVGGAERRARRGDFLAARDHGEPEGSHDHAGRRDSVPTVRLQRRDDDAVQEGGAVAQGHAVDHAGQARDPRPRRQRRHRRPARPERDGRHGAVDQHARDHHPGAGQRRPDRRARRHPRDDQDQDRPTRFPTSATFRSWDTCSSRRSTSTTRPSS